MTSDDATGRWPEEHLWPRDDAPPAEWARFYRDHLGLVCLPTPGLLDTIGHARSIARKAVASFVDKRGREPTDEESEEIWSSARDEADAARKGPIGYFRAEKFQSAADLTDKWIATFWEPVEGDRGPRGEADQRGICVRPAQSSKGFPLVDVDVDPRHGGDLAGPWGSGLVGPKASSPSGGEHTFVLSAGKEHNSQGRLAPGVDVVARGTFVCVPAGSATPARRWLSKVPPAPSPEALRRPPPPKARDKRPPRAPLPEGATRDPGDDLDDDAGVGRTAALVASPVGDGERNDVAADIVGILARPRACPDDFVRACLELLAEYLSGQDAPSDDVKRRMAEWRHLLTRGPRDADFAGEVLEVWYEARNQSAKAWKTRPRKFAASMWRTCDRHEGGNAGAEDYGVGPLLGHAAACLRPPGHIVDATALPSRDHVDFSMRLQDVFAETTAEAVPYPPPSPEIAAAAVAASAVHVVVPQWRGGIDPRTYVHGLGAIYTDDDLAQDLARRPIRIDSVFPAVDFATCKPSNSIDLLTPPISHGWGQHLSQVLRGLSPGDFRVIGAGGAGAGKTWFVSWLAHGLAMQTAARLLGVPGFERVPLVMPIWATEMPKRSEVYFRAAAAHLGFDQACLADGEEAHDAPGVAVMAAAHKMTPHEVVAKARRMERDFGADARYPFHCARYHVTKILRPSDLPRRSRRAGVNVEHRAGPDLVDHLADAVDYNRSVLATLAGVPESEVLPLMMIDPAQRFAGDAESEKRAIDAFLQAVVDVLCREVGCAVIGTSDTTKGGSRQHDIGTFLSKPAGELASDVLAGTFAIQHHADCLALCAEPASAPTPEELARMTPEARLSIKARSLRRKVHLRVLKNRNGGLPDVSFPYEWDMHLGRYRALDPEPLRPPPAQPDRQGRRDIAPTPPPISHGGPRFPARASAFADDD